MVSHVSWSIRAVDVIEVVKEAMEGYGKPGHIRSDNGPEFIAYAIQDWLEAERVETIYIAPGSPGENAYIESFHDKLRDECLNRELFGSLREAQVIVEQWRVEYNEERPHSALGYQTPAEYVMEQTNRVDVGCAPPNPRRSPRQAFWGNQALPRPCGKSPSNQTSTIRRNYSFVPSTVWGQVTAMDFLHDSALEAPEREWA